MSAASESFSALDAIESGEWDRFLHRLHGAIHVRQKTEEYRSTLLAREEADEIAQDQRASEDTEFWPGLSEHS